MRGKERIIYLLVILFIISTIFGIVGYILSSNNNKEENVVSFDGYYGTRVSVRRNNEEVHQYYDMLYLKKDGTYLLSVGSYYNNPFSVGTYEISNNTIKFKDNVRYGQNMCYYTNDLKEYDGRIVEKDNIIITINNADQVFLRNLGSEDEKAYMYVLNPNEGKTSAGFDKSWIDCTE